MSGLRKCSVLLRKEQARSTQGTRIASENKSLMKQEIVPQGACLLLFCVVRFSSPLKSCRHLIMYALVNAAGFRFVQMLERLSHPGKKKFGWGAVLSAFVSTLNCTAHKRYT